MNQQTEEEWWAEIEASDNYWIERYEEYLAEITPSASELSHLNVYGYDSYDS